jgi:cobalt-zinc-cadmium resistance protein CzcA
VIVPLALALIFVMLYFTFGSFTPAALIFLNVPFAAIGGVLALALRGLPFSISAGVGFIALFGVAVLNGVVLMSQIRDLERSSDAPLPEILRQACGLRLRPVLMTALVASLGFVPMALATARRRGAAAARHGGDRRPRPHGAHVRAPIRTSRPPL